MRQNLLTTAVLLLLGGIAIFVTNVGPSPSSATAPAPARFASSLLGTVPVAEVSEDLAPPAASQPDPLPANQLSRVREIKIARNQTFHTALLTQGISHEEIMRLVAAVKTFRDLEKVKSGEIFRIELDDAGRLQSVGFDFEIESWVRYQRQDNTFVQELGSYPVERRVCGVSGIINRSLFDSLADAGAPADLGPKMTDVLGGDVNFARDIKRGDTFRVLYEEVWKAGEFVRTGPILACSLNNAGRPVAVYQFMSADGTPTYFDASGKSLQKGLDRAPLNYSRISSNFSYNRLHPLRKRVMPHLGVDYAAPIGTPVWAAGDGVVAEMGTQGGAGRFVRIAHANRDYETVYMHFSRFAKNLKKGRHVRQGEVIGYVGASGWATGPHLDFRVKVKGQFVDPRKVKLPAGTPLPAGDHESFNELRDLFAWAMDELPVTSRPTVLPALAPTSVPNWNAEAFAAVSVPASVRAVATD
jgi:murein DD-endopeptidase MepM/ murein hydrolase activator NlpD